MSEETSNKPIHVLRRKGVKVSIFENSSEHGTFCKVTDCKVYLDPTGQWKTTHSYSRDDIPVLRLLLKRAWEWILDHEDEAKQTSSSSVSRGWTESAGYSTTKSRTEGTQTNEQEQP